MMVIGSFASYTKTKSVESAVCLLTLGDGVEQVVVNRYLMYCRIEIPEQSSGSELFFFSFLNNNEIQMK
jgi:hypothetical protein